MEKTRDSWQMLSVRIAVLLILLAGCATSHEVREPDRRNEYTISCWLFGWYICYEEANRLCPGRYKVLSEKEEFGGRELRIACPAP